MKDDEDVDIIFGSLPPRTNEEIDKLYPDYKGNLFPGAMERLATGIITANLMILTIALVIALVNLIV